MRSRKLSIRRSSVWIILPFLAYGCAAERSEPYNVLFRGGTIVDGSGGERYVGDVAIRDGLIVKIGDLKDAVGLEELDIEGLVIAPGFIDTHSHADDGLRDPDLRTNKGFITQGVTTSVFGVDGAYSLQDLRRLRQTFDSQGVGTNYAVYIGHNGIRRDAMGMDDREPSAAELTTMKDAVRAAMDEGALGLSTGLMYLPGNFATTEEVVELARVTAPYGGLYDSHIRDPANRLIESLSEAIDIAETAGVTPHPAHVKAVSMGNFGKGPEIVALVEAARERGTEVTVDQYPYDGAATAVLVSILVAPPDLGMDELLSRAFEPGLGPAEQGLRLGDYVAAWQGHLADPNTRDRIRLMTEEPPTGVYSWIDAVGYSSFRIVVTAREDRLDRMLVEVSQEADMTPFDLVAEMILEEGALPKITLGAIMEDDVRLLMKQPWTLIASDGSITGFEGGQGHPRHRGTFPRVLGRYVREWGVLSLEDAVRKMTSLPASYLRLANRGLIAEGFTADIAIFDPTTIIDRSTWAEPSLFSQGVVHVLVNGGFALREGEMTGETHGRFLPRPQ